MRAWNQMEGGGMNKLASSLCLKPFPAPVLDCQSSVIFPHHHTSHITLFVHFWHFIKDGKYSVHICPNQRPKPGPNPSCYGYHTTHQTLWHTHTQDTDCSSESVWLRGWSTVTDAHPNSKLNMFCCGFLHYFWWMKRVSNKMFTDFYKEKTRMQNELKMKNLSFST